MQRNIKFPDNLLFYLIFLLLFPISFLFHGINENFGLIESDVLLLLSGKYIIITLLVGFLARLLLTSYAKAIVLSFILLIILFLFGVFKDFAENKPMLSVVARYKFILPSIVAFAVLCSLYIKRSKRDFLRARVFIQLFLLINLLAEISYMTYNAASTTRKDLDFGDSDHTIAQHYRPRPASKPTIFWFVFDEYPSSKSLRRVWNVDNPLDSQLEAKGFFIAKNARSNYNYTQYSLVSNLDMIYLNQFTRDSVVTLRDLVKGTKSLYETNVTGILGKAGYTLENYTIYDVKDHPTRGDREFQDVPESLIDYQTLWGRIAADIGWNFPSQFKQVKDKTASLVDKAGIDERHERYSALLKRSLVAIRNGRNQKSPQFFMFHYMLPHEPFIYHADGSLHYDDGYAFLSKNFIPQLLYTNSIITNFVDTILSDYKNEDIVIIIQGDHGYKFYQNDPLIDEEALFHKESCDIMYAVYCSDKNYKGWYDSISLANSFRVVFNKYLQTGLPMLPDTSYNLRYQR